jgi:hypothetical protein
VVGTMNGERLVGGEASHGPRVERDPATANGKA